MELKKYKLGEILDVTRGASLSGEFYATEGEYIRLTCGNFDYTEKADMVRNRINMALKENKITENSVASGDSAAQSRLNSQLSHGKRITLDTVLRVLDACPDVSAEWLLRGTGELKPKAVPTVNSNNINSNVNSKVNENTGMLPESFVRDMLAEKDKQIQTLLEILKK